MVQVTEPVQEEQQQPRRRRFTPGNFLASLFGSSKVTARDAAQAQTALQQQELEMLQQTQEGRNALAELFGPAALDPSSLANIGFSRAQNTQADAIAERTRLTAQQQEQEQRQAATLNATRMLQGPIQRAQQAGATPGQIAEIFDAQAPLLRRIDPSLEDPEVFAQIRQVVAENPGVLDDIVTSLSPQQRAGGGGDIQTFVNDEGVRFRLGQEGLDPLIDPTTNEPFQDSLGTRRQALSEQGEARVETNAARARIAQAVENRSRQQFIEESETDERERIARLNNVTRVSDTVMRDVNSTFDLIDNSAFFQDQESEAGNILSGIGASVAELLPRSQVDTASRQIESIKSNIGIDQLLNIKREGSGLGQVPQSQLDLLSRLLGEMSVQVRPHILRQNLQDVLTIYSDIAAKAVQEGLDISATAAQRRETLGLPAREADASRVPTTQTQGRPVTVDDITVRVVPRGN